MNPTTVHPDSNRPHGAAAPRNGAPIASPADLVEEGAAFTALAGGSRAGEPEPVEDFDVVVVGAGQAGLSVGRWLVDRGLRFVLLDAHARVGDGWRRRWDSLHLFSTARFDGLDGLKFPGPPDDFPTKDAMGDYLESYARYFRLPVRTGMRVEHVRRDGERYLVIASGRRFRARHVVIAMAPYQEPRTPGFAAEIAPKVVQLHSRDYRRPSQLPGRHVLVVGAGNSGAEIALDLVRAGKRVSLSGKSPGQIPFDVKIRWVRRMIVPVLFRVVFHRVLTLDTPVGRAARRRFGSRGTPLVRTREQDLRAAGVARIDRTTGVRDGMPLLADGTRLPVDGIVWCTGFRLDPSWIDLPVFDAHGHPIEERGIVPGEPGFYFAGAEFIYAASSSMIHGVGRDARRIADVIAGRIRSGTSSGRTPAAA